MCVWKPSANTLPSLGENLHTWKYLYHLQFILIDFGKYKFPIKQNFCNIFLFHLPRQPAAVHDKSFQAIYSFLSVSDYSSISSSTCLKCTTNDWRSIFKIALLTSEICLIMTWICKNHFDKFPHFSSLFFSLQQCTKRLRFLNLFPPYFLLLLSATLTKQFKRDSSHWHFPHKRKQHQMNWNRKRSFDTYYWEICVWLDTITPANFP